MLLRRLTVNEPDLLYHSQSFQIIDMPVWTLNGTNVVSQARSYATWPECAPDVDVPTRFDLHVAQSPDSDYAFRG